MRYLKQIIFSILVAVALTPAPLSAGDGQIHRNANAIPNEYIVVLNDDTPRGEITGIVNRLAKQNGGEVQRIWRDALKGYLVQMNEGQARGLSHHPDVKYVEEDAQMFLSSTVPTNTDPACDPGPGITCTTSDNRLWHLDVIDQNTGVGTNDYSYCETGSGVYVYVVDLGVMRSHREFNNDPNKVLEGYDAAHEGAQFPAYNPCGGPGAFNQPPDGQKDPATVRSLSHGTGVGSLINGRSLGVAKDAKIVPIKVSPCAEYGVRQINQDTPNTFYALNEIVYARDPSTNYKVVQGGFTGSQSTYPHSNWPFPPQGTSDCCQQWGDVRLQYFGHFNTQMDIGKTIDGLDWIIRPVIEGGNPNPKYPAVVTLSTFRVAIADGVSNTPAGSSESLETAIGKLLTYNGQGIPVIASANNQDANACDTSPGRMSRGNPSNPNDPLRPYKVITAGGTMLRNNPDGNPATGGSAVNMTEPQYDASKPTLLARWRCHAGDSGICSSNIYGTPPAVAPDPTNPANLNSYAGWENGSNGGRCVTLFAPAKNIPVASMDGNTAYRDSRATGGNASGTSWSAPIVAAMTARLLQGTTGLTVDDVYNMLMSRTTPDLDPTELNPPNVTCPNDGQPCTTNKVLRLTPVVVQPLPITTTAASSGNTSLTITASGAAGLTYELYQVNSSFNVAAYNTGAWSSTKIAGPQPSNVFSVPSTAGISYFARVRSSCGTGDTNITTITSSLDAPTNANATAVNGLVTISWNAVSGATGYSVQRKIGTGAWSVAQTVTSGTQTSVTDAPTVPTGVVLYRVVATQGTSSSNPSNADVAYTKNFTDDPILISSPFTLVKARHLVEARQAVNALFELAGSGPIYAGNSLDEAYIRTLRVDSSDFTTLMANLNSARSALGLPSVSFQITPASGGLIRGTQMANMRSGVI